MGTYHWMAPEIFENKNYTIKADVYSFGVNLNLSLNNNFQIVLYEIICRLTPYIELKNP